MSANRVQDIEKRTDYEAIMKEFGIAKIEDLLPSIGTEHIFFRRGIIFAHRDFDKILQNNEGRSSWAIVSGRGPSNDLHFGHLILFEAIRYLQEKYDCHFYLPFSDDEKYVFRKISNIEDTYSLVLENAADIFAIGLDPDRTHAYISSQSPNIYKMALNFSINLTYNSIKAAFGFIGDENPGAIFYSCIQAAHILQPTVDENLPVIVPIGLDQDVYMRLTRDIAGKRKLTMPGSIYIKYLKGLNGKPMSSSSPESSVFLRDPPKVVKKKIMNAFTGGRATIKEQRELGANPHICTVFDWFEKFFIHDDKELLDIQSKCKNGGYICGLDCKPKLLELVVNYQERYNKRRKKVLDRLQDFFIHNINLKAINSTDEI